MRQIVLAGLMAATTLSASAPAYAQQGDNNNGGWRGRTGERGGEVRQQRSETRDARQQQRSEQPQRQQPQIQQPQAQQPQIQQPRVVQQQVAPQQRRDWREDRRDVREDRRDVREDVRDARNGNNGWRDRAEDRRDVREDRRDIREDRRDGQNGWQNNWQNGRQNAGRYDNRADRTGNWGNNGATSRNWNGGNRYDGRYLNNRRLDSRERWSDQRRWDNGWRSDRRYDWQSYRRSYGNVYRPGRYYAPRGWGHGYQRFSIGIYLNSLLYSNSYWLDDPYQYRLPPAYGSLRWVRYYDDALLVDVRDGYVVDVINGFFY